MNSPAPPGELIRRAGVQVLAQALRDSRRDTLATFALFEAALAPLRMQVPHHPTLNPPLWELGHIGWFQEHWLARHSERERGPAADPQARRSAPLRQSADDWYDSSRVPHAHRWQLELPDADATRDDLAQGLAHTLELLHEAVEDDTGLYFHRLVLLHEDMHHEAALTMAQTLGLAVDDPRWQPRPLPAPGAALDLPAGPWRLGSEDAGFAFDNELAAHAVAIAPGQIDAQVLRWAEYLPFVADGGYDEERWWTAAGRAWRADRPHPWPRYLRPQGANWQQASDWQHRRHGRWQPLNLAEPACHLTQHEALAWCAWAGRRLPSEAEWEAAALRQAPSLVWGDVWEWTSSPFEPYAGFTAHPYQDYSRPWFGSRAVLRGGSFATQPRIKHPRYRNFFPAERNDIFAGLRSCAR